ncbi:MAG: hypothetical protein ACSHYF_04245 [Verrucomicrobiaceae bacterium]
MNDGRFQLWPLSGERDELFVAGKSLGEWEEELGRTFEVTYPWDLLAVNEAIISEICDWPGHELIQLGDDSRVIVGEGTKILPGVYVEGSVIIGRDCKIGPNCYLRGSTTIGDSCHVGQAVEVKNSILGHGTSVGHLSYVGDSVLGAKVNFGAGTITSNLRHDGANHRSAVAGGLRDTGRRKLGVIIGAGVHTGINTSFYPGRKLGPGTSTLPGEIVSHDIQES